MSNKTGTPKRRNNEKRKEKSRVAAKCRRSKELQIFNELTAALPAKKEEVEQLDKASVMRLAISYLRVRDVVGLLPQDSTPQSEPVLQIPDELKDVASELSYMKALDGFVLVLSQQGDIVYCSENIAEHIGVTQTEIMGQSVYEFSHPCDHDEVREALRTGSAGRRELLLRLKCTLTGKGRNIHLKSASYKVIRVTGHMLTDEKLNKEMKEKTVDKKHQASAALVAVARPIQHPSNIEIPLDSKTFLSKHSLDMKFTYADESLLNTLGFEAEELIGKSLYDYHHAADSCALAQLFKSLFSKGQCETGQYRFLAKFGGFAWVQTQATVITDKQMKPISVVCVNYVVSGIECRDEVFAAHQLEHVDLKPVLSKTASPVPQPEPAIIPNNDPLETPNGAIVAVIPAVQPIPVTELIFAPRNKEMNEGFFKYSQDQGITMLKDEPDDLTQLAPTPGDACIPLASIPLGYDLDDDFGLNYCSLLGDELGNGSPVDSLTADSLFLSSPETQETDSSSFLTDLSLDNFDCGRSDGDSDGTSPFIPLSDDLPVLESAVMWGALPDSVYLARPQPSEVQPTSNAPALQRLLAAPPTGPPPQDLITNIYSDQGLIPSKCVTSWDTGMKRTMKQDEAPHAKRVKRSPSPLEADKPKQASSSVLMNLLDKQQHLQMAQRPQNVPRQYIFNPKYQLVKNTQRIQHNIQFNKLPIPNIIMKNQANNPTLIQNQKMLPLSLNVDSYASPNYSPCISPAQNDKIVYQNPSPQRYTYSPISGQNSPVGVILNRDPYLNKMQVSPNVLSPIDSLLDSNVTLNSPYNIWSDTEMMQTTSELLSALDDVKLV